MHWWLFCLAKLIVHVSFSESHIFIFQDTFDSEANCKHVQSFKDPPFKRCLYNGSYVRNGRLLHQCFLRHILISSGWRQNLFLAAWRGSLSEAADLNLETTRYVMKALSKKQPVRPKLHTNFTLLGRVHKIVAKYHTCDFSLLYYCLVCWFISFCIYLFYNNIHVCHSLKLWAWNMVVIANWNSNSLKKEHIIFPLIFNV